MPARHWLGVGVVVFACSTPLGAQTLPEAVQRTIASYPQIQESIYNQRATTETISQARAGYFPTIDATAGYGRERTDPRVGESANLDRKSADVALSQMLFDGGAVSSQVRIQESRTENASYGLADTVETISFRTVQFYLDVLRLRTNVDIARSNVETHQRTLEQVSLLAEKGAGRRSDVEQAEARLALARSNLTGLQRQLEQSENAFRQLVGMAPQQLQKPGAPIERLPPKEETAVGEALASNPAIKAAQATLEAARADRDSSKSRLAPRITLDLGSTFEDNADGLRGSVSDQIATLRLRYNLFRGGADSARIRESVQRIDQAQSNLDRIRTDVEREIRTAWESLRRDEEQLVYLKAHADTSAKVVDAYRQQFRLGQRSLLDVLNAENEHFNARRAYIDGDYAVIGGVYRILTGLGRLVESLGLSRPPEAQPPKK